MGEDVAGWKIGRLTPDLADRFGVDRFIGPVYAGAVANLPEVGPAHFAMFAGGSAAFEVECVAFAALREGAIGIGSATIGIEIASSPVQSLPDHGSLASVADLGNNAGQLFGAAVPVDRLADAEGLACETSTADAPPVARSAASLPGGPMAAFAFAVAQAERLGRLIRDGQFINTGAVTGMHAVRPGQQCSADFGIFGRIDCAIVARDAAVQQKEAAA